MCQFSRSCFVFLGLALATQAFTQGSNLPWEEYDKLINTRSAIGALDTDLFGDQVNLYNTGLSFSVTDVSLPGNNDLPVVLTRTFSVQSKEPSALKDLPMGTWDMDLPRLEGVFAAYDSYQVWPNNRCTDSDGIPDPDVNVGGTDYPAEHYWHGIHAHMPGGGELLLADQGAEQPDTSGDWRWMTSSFTYFRCLESIDNHTGEGFLAITSDGNRYWFKWMAQYQEPSLQAPEASDGSPPDDVLPDNEPPDDELPEDELPDDEVPHIANSLPRKRNVLYATRVEDRFGNYVNYTFINNYNQPARLTRIEASDGREITLSYNAEGHVATVSDATHTWTYHYNSGHLNRVELPDGSKWAINFSGLWDVEFDHDGDALHNCNSAGLVLGLVRGGSGTVTHPSGATGEFEVNPVLHGRSNVPKICINWAIPNNDPQNDFARWPRQYDLLGITKKRVTGPGLTPIEWTYTSGSDFSWEIINDPPICDSIDCDQPVCLDDDCAGTARTTVEGPGGEWTRYTFGNSYRYNEGKLLKVERGTGPGTILRTEQMQYELAQSGQSFPVPVGTSPSNRGNVFAAASLAPLRRRDIYQQDTIFSYIANDFDALARPVDVTRENSLNQYRNEVTQYHDNWPKWILDQIAWRDITGETNGKNITVRAEETTYSPNLALPQVSKRFGKIVQTLTWDTTSSISSGQRGTVKSVADGKDNLTTVSNWKRGIPQTITYADGTSTSAVVNNDGTLASVIDEIGNRTCYSYDAMGRLERVTWPSETTIGICDDSAWNSTNQVFEQVNTSEYGIGPGHWRQTISNGNGYTVSYFDGLWQTLLTREYDSDNEFTTQRFSRYSYDHKGRTIFASYPSETSIANLGVTTHYDAIGRVTGINEDSDLGVLNTTIEYLFDFAYHTRTTDPNGNVTKTYFQGFDEPDYESVLLHDHPEGAATVMARNFLGEVDCTRRQDVTAPSRLGEMVSACSSTAGYTVAASRFYVYNIHRELCKVIEPETGTTVMAYDNAGNLAWRAEGLNLTNIESCDIDLVPLSERISYDYDSRNRLIQTEYPDGRGDTSYQYWPDGLLKRIAADETTTYEYNARGLLTSESLLRDRYLNLLPPPLTSSWWPAVSYTYNRNGHVEQESRSIKIHEPPFHTAQSGAIYNPNALGQPTRIGDFATGITYHPNGSVQSFTYGNGITHDLEQNTRGLPRLIIDDFGSTRYVDETYDYDGNGNVLFITDAATGANQRGNRNMTYDGLDRLTQVVSPMFGSANYFYDVLNNLRQVDVTGGNSSRNQHYCYTNSNRLVSIGNGSCAGSPLASFSYYPDGKMSSKNTTGQVPIFYDFDYGDRLRSVSGQFLAEYDGHGRRTSYQNTGTLGESRSSYYNLEGKLVYSRHGEDDETLFYYYLGSRLIAVRTSLHSVGGYSVRYQHADALGSPIAITDENRTVVERTEFEPYGAVINRPLRDGVGYTGHLEDESTGLVYMQQRYYDPMLGRFISADPVGADRETGGNFNRYWYANNNPYTFTDPDGQLAFLIPIAAGAIAGAVINTGVQITRAEGSFTERLSQVDLKQVGVAAGAGALGGGAGVIAGTATTTAGTIGANVVAGGAIGAGAVHANAALDGRTASVGEVAKGAALAAGLSGAASAVAAAPGAAGRAATASMSQTEQVATGNLIQGIANTTKSAGGNLNFAPAGQGAANAAAATISNADNLQAKPKDETENR